MQVENVLYTGRQPTQEADNSISQLTQMRARYASCQSLVGRGDELAAGGVGAGWGRGTGSRTE